MFLFKIFLLLLFSTTSTCQVWVWAKPTKQLEANILLTIEAIAARIPDEANKAKYIKCSSVHSCGIDGPKRGIVLNILGNLGWGDNKDFGDTRDRVFGVYYLVTDKTGKPEEAEPVRKDSNGMYVSPVSGLHQFDRKVWRGKVEENVILKMHFTSRHDSSDKIQRLIDHPSIHVLTFGVKNTILSLSLIGIPFVVHSVRKELAKPTVQLSDDPIPASMDLPLNE